MNCTFSYTIYLATSFMRMCIHTSLLQVSCIQDFPTTIHVYYIEITCNMAIYS